MYKIIDKYTLPNGIKIQLEDWHEENTKEFPKLYGYTIGCYPIAKNSSIFVLAGETFRLSVSRNEYCGYTDEMVLADYESLKNGTKTIPDLRKHFWYGDKDAFYLGLIDKESISQNY